LVALYYQAADALLHAAKADNFPCVVLEALACGTPVITTAIGGIPEQIVDEVTGFLVPRGDSQMMAKKIQHLMNSPVLCRAMSEAAAKRARDKFDLNHQVQRYLGFYEELVSYGLTLTE
jgi:glycosyltransferase involved in cell wall biosynthesis